MCDNRDQIINKYTLANSLYSNVIVLVTRHEEIRDAGGRTERLSNERNKIFDSVLAYMYKLTTVLVTYDERESSSRVDTIFICSFN